MVSMMTERMPTTGMGMGTGMMGGTAGTMPTNMLMVPRCTYKMEKCQGGMKITCSCTDANACGMMQNLCQMLAGGMVSCCMMMNGMAVCTCNLTMGMCKCETTANGVCVTCTSGDKTCESMLQACCDCMACMLKAGCSCCMCINNNPVCCGCC